MDKMLTIGSKQYSIHGEDGYLNGFNGVFEPELVRLFETVAHGHIIDVGANVGCTALLFSELGDYVDAFEPSPSTYVMLQKNTSTTSNIVAHNIGLGDSEKKATITFSANNRSGAFVSDGIEVSQGHITEDIKLTTLDRFVKKQNPPSVDFLKIDVEGFELNVLAGAEKTLLKFAPAVVLEMNHWCLNVFRNKTIPDFLGALRATFPHLYAVHEDTYQDLHNSSESYAVMYHHILGMKYSNILCGLDETHLERFFSTFRHMREIS